MYFLRKSSLGVPWQLNSVGLAGQENVQGEDQKKLDVLSDEIMVNALRASGKTSVLVTEERVSTTASSLSPAKSLWFNRCNFDLARTTPSSLVKTPSTHTW